MHPLSVVIITFNEEENIARCILSVKKVADEVIVLDSFSTDKTVHIASELGAVVYQEKFRGYIGQKNLAIKYASHNYVLSLDADEALDEELSESILQAKNSLSYRAYRMNRCTNYCGQFIKHGLWYPDKKIRLFDRRVAVWGGLNPHDKVILNEKFTIKKLKGDILHYSFEKPEDLVWQNNRMTSIAAASLYSNGRRSSWFKMLFNPAWAFFYGYVCKLGFMDGTDGFTIAISTSYQVFLKYSKLYRLQKTQRRNAASQPVKSMDIETRPAVIER
jgi:glycosyltransferase involved in cell wall biosynthesis